MKTHRCHDCDVFEGELHVRGCDMERCPFCGGQLITCGCNYKHFYPDFDSGEYPGQVPFDGLPRRVYERGLPQDQAVEWELILAAKGRIPWISYPNLCARCGTPWPRMFNVSDSEWEKYVEPAMRSEMLCRPCFNWIKGRIDKAVPRHRRASLATADEAMHRKDRARILREEQRRLAVRPRGARP